MSRNLFAAGVLLVCGVVVTESCAKNQKSPLQGTPKASSAMAQLVTSPLSGHYSRTPVVVTLAGDGNEGMIDATGTAAEFSVPRSLAVDAAGNIYVTDQFNRRIRMITPAGVVSTLSGAIDGPAQVIEGAAANARYCDPYGIAINATGTLYISDITSEGIRQISNGFVTSLAGNPAVHSPFPRGLVNGNGGSARFDEPLAVAVEMSTGGAPFCTATPKRSLAMTVAVLGSMLPVASASGKGANKMDTSKACPLRPRKFLLKWFFGVFKKPLFIKS